MEASDWIWTVVGEHGVLPFEETLERLERRSVDLILQLASHKKKIDNLLGKKLAYNVVSESPSQVTYSPH